MFDLDFNFIRSIGSCGKGRSEFSGPREVKFDNTGNISVAERDDERVQVMDIDGCYIRVFGQEKEKLRGPSALDKYVYVSDLSDHCIVVYESLSPRHGHEEGEFCLSYLDEYMYRERYGRTAREPFDSIMADIAHQYPV